MTAIAPPLFPSSPLASQPASQWNVFGCEQEDQTQVCSSPVDDYVDPDATDDEEESAGDSAIVYEDGELSPGFDASFASSLSINSNLSDQANAMDISPAEARTKPKTKRSLASFKRTELQQPPAATFNKSFFSQLTTNKPRSLSSTSLHADSLSPPVISRPALTQNNTAPHAATTGRSFGQEVDPNLAFPGKRERSQSETNLVFGKASGNTMLKKALPRPGLRDAAARMGSASVGGHVLDKNPLGSKIRPPIPAEFRPMDRAASDSVIKKRWPGIAPNERHVSEPSVPTFTTLADIIETSSPPLDAMDIDPKSPQAQIGSKQHFQSSEHSFSEFFEASPQGPTAQDIPNLPQPSTYATGQNAKKRSYEPEQSFEASSDDAAPSSPLAPLTYGARPPLVKAASMAAGGSMFGSGRRRGSDRTINKRPSLATLQGSRAPSVEVSPPREDQQQAKKSRADLEGQSRPSYFKPRRAHSVHDAVFDNPGPFSSGTTATFKSLGLGAPPSNQGLVPPRNASAPTDYFGFKPRHAPSASESMANMFGAAPVLTKQRPASGSQMQGPSTGFPESWGSEADGKALPCHSTKEDGLMRIMPTVMNDLLEGKYASLIPRYVIIDCRFKWEYDGGHIRGAINLPTVEDVEAFLLRPNEGLWQQQGSLPMPSKSVDPAPGGKTVIIFHCEFSEKRAPTAAGILRKKDRNSCHEQYPRVHYPELYVLTGGYAAMYQTFPTQCDPIGYVQMKDSIECPKAYDEFRRRSQLGRARSFTFGLGQDPQDNVLASKLTISNESHQIVEEEQENSSGSSPSVKGDSPCPINAAAKARTIKGMSLPGRKTLNRASTEASLDFGKALHPSARRPISFRKG